MKSVPRQGTSWSVWRTSCRPDFRNQSMYPSARLRPRAYEFFQQVRDTRAIGPVHLRGEESEVAGAAAFRLDVRQLQNAGSLVLLFSSRAELSTAPHRVNGACWDASVWHRTSQRFTLAASLQSRRRWPRAFRQITAIGRK